MACCCNDSCKHEKKENKKLEVIILFIRVLLAILFCGLSFLNVFNKLIWQYVLNIIAYLIVGYDVLYRAIKNIFKGELFDENFLMSLATILALVIKEFPEAVAVMLLYQIGEFFQDMAVDKSKDSIMELFEINDETAVRINNNQEEIVDLDDINVNDVILVKPGNKIPVDGIIIQGKSRLNMAQLTGESIPYEVVEGNEVLSGSLNINSALYIKATKKYNESTTYKMQEMIKNASKKKAKSEKFITKFSKIYTPIVILLALIVAFVIPLILGFDAYFKTYLHRALTFMIISCPCALVISIPLSFFAGIGKSARVGILAKSSEAIENFANVKAIAFDKTGTITKGNFVVVDESSINQELFINLLYQVETKFDHPIAISIVDFYKNRVTNKLEITDVLDIPGYGITASYLNKKILIGNENLFKENKIDLPTINKVGTMIYLAYDNAYLGYVCLADTLKDDSKQAINLLMEQEKLKTYLISGDKKEVVEDIASKVNITNTYYQMLPEDKVNAIKTIKNENNGLVAYVGDGINDAACLIESDVGIAMGGLGADLAIESADLVIMDDSLTKLVKGHKIAKKTLTIAKENIIFALTIKLLVLILGAFGYAPMWIAILSDVGVCLLAILNSLRILTTRTTKNVL